MAALLCEDTVMIGVFSRKINHHGDVYPVLPHGNWKVFFANVREHPFCDDNAETSSNRNDGLCQCLLLVVSDDGAENPPCSWGLSSELEIKAPVLSTFLP